MMILLLFLLLSRAADALSLEESISMYKSSRNSRLIDLNRDLYEQSYKQYSQDFAFKANPVGVSFHSAPQYYLDIELTPSFRLLWFNVSVNDSHLYPLKSGESIINFNNIKVSVSLLDLFYYSSYAYARDKAFYNMEQNKITAKIQDRENIDNIIDLYAAIHGAEEQLNIKFRTLEHLEQDREFMELKKQMGVVSEIDMSQSDIELESTKNDIDQLKRNIEINKRSLCSKIRATYTDSMTILPFEAESSEIEVDSSNIDLLKSQIELNRLTSAYDRRALLPNLEGSIQYGKNDYSAGEKEFIFGASFTWDFTGNSSSLENDAVALEYKKMSLESAEEMLNIALISKQNEYDDLISSFELAEKNRDYWRKVADIKRDMYKQDLISFQEYMRYFNKFKEQSVLANDKKHKLAAFKRKQQLLHEMKKER